MGNYSTTPFKPWHLKMIKPGKHYVGPDLDPETRARLYRHIEGVTLLLDGEICAILGVAVLWHGVAELTMIPTDLFYKNIKSGVKMVRKMIEIAGFTWDLHRLQATCLASEPKHARFLEVMGLRFEGHLHGYGPSGEDFFMYAYCPVRND